MSLLLKKKYIEPTAVKSPRVQVPAINGMQVGYIRKLMNRMRKQADLNGGRCNPDFRLTEEYTAGEFAIEYLIGNYHRRTSRQVKKKGVKRKFVDIPVIHVN
jgi:hypothetical protein